MSGPTPEPSSEVPSSWATPAMTTPPISTDPPINPPTVGNPDPTDVSPSVTPTPMVPPPPPTTPTAPPPSATSTGTSAPVEVPDGAGGPGLLLVAVILVAVLALAALIAFGVLAGRRRAAQTGRGSAAPERPAPQVVSAQARTDGGSTGAGWAPPAATDWAAATAAITAFDLATSAAGRYDAEQSLAQLGVTRLPVRRGDPVDPRAHNVVERRPDPNLAAGTVAEVVRPGWVTATEMLRPADVTIVA